MGHVIWFVNEVVCETRGSTTAYRKAAVGADDKKEHEIIEGESRPCRHHNVILFINVTHDIHDVIVIIIVVTNEEKLAMMCRYLKFPKRWVGDLGH